MYLRRADYSRKAKYEVYDHIKKHFNIWLQSGKVRAPGESTENKNNNFTGHYKY